jgi:UDP-2,3-diacylglucosamine hydrolase
MHSNIIIVADPHLGTKTKDTAILLSFIRTLDPIQTKLVFLGDLFHIWAGPSRYHLEDVRTLLHELDAFQKSGGETYLVVGNRDLLFRKFEKDSQYLPFNKIANDFLSVNIGSFHVVFNHGDLVNRKDKKYLKWRSFVRHPLFELIMNVLPVKWANQILISGEKNLKTTNQVNRKAFPETEWEKFIEQTHLSFQYDILLIGHFHPDKVILNQYKKSSAIVVPGWLSHQSYGILNKQGEFSIHRYSA